MANDKNSFISGEGLGGEDKLLVSHVADMVSICERTCSSRFFGVPYRRRGCSGGEVPPI
ncbi:MAG: hypothetical protein L6V87_10360 [Ruminococcus sp.]|nr:MAG: hypothetical protein L6V87_10360 [Ruminococcus sp.]